MTQNNAYVLIHSPLVGQLTWSLVADEMRRRDLAVLVPSLTDSPSSGDPSWKQHALSASKGLSVIPSGTNAILVAHSGAGPLLPVIRQSIPNPAQAYILVDAGLPRDGATRLDMMKLEDPEWATQFERELEHGKRFPTWSFDDLQEVIPDQAMRRQMVAELRPRGLSFFSETIPVFKDWPDAPCAYIRFSTPYDRSAAQARSSGWLVHELDAGHFHMLVDPVKVTDLIVNSVSRISSKTP